MANWWNSFPLGATGVTGILAYLGGLLTTPLQNQYQERRDSKQLRKALYVEIASILSHYVLTLEEIRRDPSIGHHIDIYVKKLWPCPCYEHAKLKPVTLNLLKDIKGINAFYGGLEALSDGLKAAIAGGKPQIWFAGVFVRAGIGFHYTAADKLDIPLLLEVGDDRVKNFISGLIDIKDTVAKLDKLSKLVSPSPSPPQP